MSAPPATAEPHLQPAPLWCPVVAAIALATVACTALAYLQGAATVEQAVRVGLLAAAAVTTAGFHLLLSHLWVLVGTLLALIGHPFGTAVAACVGVHLVVPWYLLVTVRRDMMLARRAFVGWGGWLLEDVLGGTCVYQPHNLKDVPRLLVIGFHVGDIGVHLIPAAVLMQKAAAQISLSSVLAAYALVRIWVLLVCSPPYLCCAVRCGVMWWCTVAYCFGVWAVVVWCGVVWCGVVWCGVVWCGVVWCGVVWCPVVPSATAESVGLQRDRPDDEWRITTFPDGPTLCALP